MNPNKITLLVLLAMLVFPLNVKSQNGVVIDQVIAVVGNSAILESDITNQRRQLQGQGIELGTNPDCIILDDILFQKLLFNQAIIDSVIVNDEQVEQVLDRRLRFFIQQIGSRERLEAYYGKSIDEIKEEFREVVREQEMARMMEVQITENVRVTPSEVRHFFNRLPPDSIPLIETEIILAQIVKEPPVSQQEITNVTNRLEEYRQRIIRGTSFATLAILYSEDPGSARRGGELGFFGRGELYPEFEAAAFALRPGETSEIVETQAGFHIIQMIERRGEQFNVRHLLIRPKVSPIELNTARNQLDSIRNIIQQGNMTFEDAARQFSDDPGRVNQGLMVNPVTGTNRFRPEDIDPNLFFVIDRMTVGSVSAPVGFTDEEGNQAFRLVKLVERTEPRLANLERDYDFIQQLALQEKKRESILNWVKNRLPNTFVFIHEKYRHCDYDLDWLRNN
ncbi:MAG TPA: peptidylprolyl isomerase [Bacteroidales bacterium]|nr:peptidylprolyl isomerase [Bacteroidales bacterium]